MDPLINWVAVGYGSNQILYSSDGITWDPADGDFGGGGSYGNEVAYGTDSSGSPLWVAVGDGTNQIQYSTNGRFWNDATGSFGGGGYYGIAYGYNPEFYVFKV